jgi:hypothetical protein
MNFADHDKRLGPTTVDCNGTILTEEVQVLRLLVIYKTQSQLHK